MSALRGFARCSRARAIPRMSRTSCRTIKERPRRPKRCSCSLPKGDVINLPMGATVIDFAYAIHSAVGNRMTGAKVDGRIVPIDHQGQDRRDQSRVLTSSQPGQGPEPRLAQHSARRARRAEKIRNWFKKERRDENIAEGKAELEREIQTQLHRLPERRA